MLSDRWLGGKTELQSSNAGGVLRGMTDGKQDYVHKANDRLGPAGDSWSITTLRAGSLAAQRRTVMV
ncbi:MAG: hypothetical protein U1D30_25450 [Planctomycetota bacterium]